MFDDQSDSANKYLIYQLGNEHFTTPLIEVREVIEYRSAKPIPQTSAFFKGVINIRGEIIGVLDLRERLGLKGSDQPMAQLVFETANGPLAAIVDVVHSVTIINDADLERRPAVHSGQADRDYFAGIAKVDGRMLTVISLRKILSPEQLVDLSKQPT